MMDEVVEKGELVSQFRAYLKGYVGTRNDEVALTVIVPKEWKYLCLPITDNLGYMYEFEVRKISREKISELVDVEEDD